MGEHVQEKLIAISKINGQLMGLQNDLLNDSRKISEEDFEKIQSFLDFTKELTKTYSNELYTRIEG